MLVSEIMEVLQGQYTAFFQPIFRAQVRLILNSTKTTVWIEFPAANANVAKAQLQQLYGRGNVLSVMRKSRQPKLVREFQAQQRAPDPDQQRAEMLQKKQKQLTAEKKALALKRARKRAQDLARRNTAAATMP
jgi:hypothetical protein